MIVAQIRSDIKKVNVKKDRDRTHQFRSDQNPQVTLSMSLLLALCSVEGLRRKQQEKSLRRTSERRGSARMEMAGSRTIPLEWKGSE